MYSLACINLSSEAHTYMPSVRHSIRFSRCRGGLPLARASLRRKKELYQHPACRVKENFQEIFPTRCGGARALRPRAPRVAPASRAFAAGVSHYTSPRRFVKGVIRKSFRRTLNTACRRVRTTSYLRGKRAYIYLYFNSLTLYLPI